MLSKNWYAIYTKARNEKKVAELLTRDGISNYLPLMKRIKVWSDRKKKVEEPLFTSYVFVYITEKEHLKVLQVPGVVRYISFEGKKVTIRPEQIEAIKKFVETGEEFVENEADFIPGKRVKVFRGALKGLEGRLVEILGKQRVKVEIDAIGQSVYIKIPIGSLEVL
jgi:transcriptional antiterminator RfaH